MAYDSWEGEIGAMGQHTHSSVFLCLIPSQAEGWRRGSGLCASCDAASPGHRGRESDLRTFRYAFSAHRTVRKTRLVDMGFGNKRQDGRCPSSMLLHPHASVDGTRNVSGTIYSGHDIVQLSLSLSLCEVRH